MLASSSLPYLGWCSLSTRHKIASGCSCGPAALLTPWQASGAAQGGSRRRGEKRGASWRHTKPRGQRSTHRDRLVLPHHKGVGLRGRKVVRSRAHGGLDAFVARSPTDGRPCGSVMQAWPGDSMRHHGYRAAPFPARGAGAARGGKPAPLRAVGSPSAASRRAATASITTPMPVPGSYSVPARGSGRRRSGVRSECSTPCQARERALG